MINKLKSLTTFQKLVVVGVLLAIPLIAIAAPLKATEGIGIQGDTLDIVNQIDRTPHIRIKRTVTGGGNVELDLLTGRQVTRPFVSFTTLDATPSVQFGNTFKTANAGATTITAFDDGVSGQRITIIVGDANTAISDAGTLKLSAAIAAGAGTVDDTLTIEFDGTNWYEVARSVN